MELACSIGCSISTWGVSSSRMPTSLGSRGPWWVTPGRGRFQVRVGEELGTEKLESEEKSVGTYERPPQQQRKWTGYVEKDTAGQTNIYAVEPTVYVSESLFSNGEAGGQTGEGTNSTVPLAIGLGLAALASAALILVTMTKNAPVSTKAAVGYNGPPLGYYIAKFTPDTTVGEAVAPELLPEIPSVDL